MDKSTPSLRAKRSNPAGSPRSLRELAMTIILLLLSPTLFADQLIIEPDMGRRPILSAIQQARQSIQLVIYGFTDQPFFDALLRQQQHGTTLKIILEQSPYMTPTQNNKIIQQFNQHHFDWQGHIPPFRYIHQKTLLIDGREAIIMTFNFTKSTFKNQRNFALVIDDPAKVKEIETIFSADWNHVTASPHSPDLIYSPYDSRNKLIHHINQAKQTLNIYAQSLSDYKTVGALAAAARRGVTVNILTSSSLRTKPVQYLTKAGVNIRQSHHYYIHAKVFIIDNQNVILGSINLTRASLDDNRELAILTTDPLVAKQMNATFNTDWNDPLNVSANEKAQQS